MSDSFETTASPVVSSNVPPSVTVYGVGGAGINQLRLALPDLVGRVSYARIDTSRANLQHDEQAIIIGGGGSGLVRSLNVEATVKALAGLPDENLGLSDVNIVLFSLSGGSGSVIGPLLIGDITRRKKLVIALTIASTQSEKHTKNTLQTLQSLRKVTENSSLYLPITIFNNSSQGGPAAVDRAFPYKLARLVDLLTAPTFEIDKNDRQHWLNVPKTLEQPLVGLRLLYVTTSNNGVKEIPSAEIWPDAPGHIYDSLLSISTAQYQVENKPRARVSFEGRYTTIQLVPSYGVLGNAPRAFENLTRTIEETLLDYETNTEKNDDPFGNSQSSHKSGLVI